MMQKTHILSLYAYNRWANHRILQATEHLDASQLLAPTPVSHGSLRGTLVHILGTEWIWRLRCQESLSSPALLAEEQFPALEVLQTLWREEENAWRAFLEGLDDEALQRVVHYSNTKGVPFATPLWQILFHVVNHGTQFRSEAAVVLTSYQHSPGDLDYIAFVRENCVNRR
jgi:uncharacterized damage-inducible protein DinB